MPNLIIPPRDLPDATEVFATDSLVVDNGATVSKATPVQIVDAGRAWATIQEAQAGTVADKSMSPLTTAAAISSQVLDQFGSEYMFADYAAALGGAGDLDPSVLVISADVGGTETRWIRDGAGTALGGGWAPAGTATPQHYGAADAAGLAAAVAANANSPLRIDFDAQVFPSNYSNVLLEYATKATVRAYGLVTFEPVNTAQRMVRTMHPTRGAGNEIGQMIEATAIGSGLNGPSNATIAEAVAIAKQGYGSGSAVGGEIDGLRITVRQDGPQGLLNNDPGSSDSAGLLINVQNRGDCGWIAAYEAQTTNAAVGGGVARQLQTKIGVINTNDTLKRSYGFSAVANVGSNHSAFYSLGFDYALFADAGLAIRPSGEHAIITPDWPSGGGRFLRGQGVNDATTIQGRGTNGITITAPEGFVSFATGGTVRMRVAADGHWVPDVTNGANLGASSLRWNNAFLTALNVAGNNITLSGLSVYADNAAAIAGGLGVGRVYRTAAGDLKVVV